VLNQDQENEAVNKTLKEENNQKYFRLCCREDKAATEICDHNMTEINNEE